MKLVGNITIEHIIKLHNEIWNNSDNGKYAKFINEWYKIITKYEKKPNQIISYFYNIDPKNINKLYSLMLNFKDKYK